MNTLATIIAIVLIIVGDIIAFTKYKDVFTYEVEETYLVDDNGKIIKKLGSKRVC